MSHTLLHSWGISNTEDFGQIVFNLVEYGIFGKTDSDRIEDFNAVYDFEKTFVDPFRPEQEFVQACPHAVGQEN